MVVGLPFARKRGKDNVRKLFFFKDDLTSEILILYFFLDLSLIN